eukprot:3410562-Heterocapsa_arctica.AAC.1
MDVGRRDERSRYRVKNSAKEDGPRAMALGAWRDALSDTATVFVPPGTMRPETEWVQNPGFEEVLAARVQESDWRFVYAGRYERQKTMHVSEAKE